MPGLDQAREHVFLAQPQVKTAVLNRLLWLEICTFTEESFNPSITRKGLNVTTKTPDKCLSPTCKISQAAPYLPTTVSFLNSYSAFADLCNLWRVARSVALENVRAEWLRAEVTGCDNFCLADKHRQNHSSFLFSITMNYALGCQRSFMCPYSLRGPVLFFPHNTTVTYLFLPVRCYALAHLKTRKCSKWVKESVVFLELLGDHADLCGALNKFALFKIKQNKTKQRD